MKSTHTDTNTHAYIVLLHAFRILLDCMKLLPQQVIGATHCGQVQKVRAVAQSQMLSYAEGQVVVQGAVPAHANIW